jgi:predicted dehydrogenase
MLLTMRHEPKYATIRKLVSEGLIGQVSQVSSQKSYRLGDRPEWQKSRATLGGTIPFIGIHALDLMRWTTGLEYTHVAAFHGRIGHPELKELETHATLALQMTGGVSACSRLDYLRPETAPTHGDDRLRIAGDAGVIEALSFEGDIRVTTAKGEPYRVSPAPTANLFTEFVQSVRAGKPPRITADDACYMTEVVLHARQAADDRKLVELPARRPIAAAKS